MSEYVRVVTDIFIRIYLNKWIKAQCKDPGAYNIPFQDIVLYCIVLQYIIWNWARFRECSNQSKLQS